MLGKELSGAARSSLSEARQKLDWRAFEYLLKESRLERDELSRNETWKGHVVYSIDGTKLTLPNSKEILAKFPQRKATRGPLGSVSHYPFAVMVSSCNVLTAQPLSARIMNMHGSEREGAISLIQEFKKGDICLLDRGLDGLRVWKAIEDQGQFYVNRLRVVYGSGHKHLDYAGDFVRSGKKEAVIKRRLRDPQTQQWIQYKMRLIRGRKLKDGAVLVVGTNLFDKNKYPAHSLLDLYSRRWRIETMYARVKTLLQVQGFHARTVNGVYQEVFANLLILSMTAAISLRAAKLKGVDPNQITPNFKNATEVLKRNLFITTGSLPLTPNELKQRALWIINQVVRVLCKKQPGRSYPRYSRQPLNRWPYAKADKIKAHDQGRRANEAAWSRKMHKTSAS